jgi:excisionase family DNA binding protein
MSDTSLPRTEDRRAFRVNSACYALGISRSHLYSLEKKNQIRLIRIGGRTLVPATEIERLLREGA